MKLANEEAAKKAKAEAAAKKAIADAAPKTKPEAKPAATADGYSKWRIQSVSPPKPGMLMAGLEETKAFNF